MEVTTYEILLSEAQKVREALIEKRPDTKEPIDNLLLFMEPYSYKPTNKIYPCGAKGRSTLRREHEGRLRFLLALKASQGS